MILVFLVEPGAYRLAKLPLDPHCSSQEGHILRSERQQLGNPQAKAGVCDHHCLTPRWHCLSQGLHRATDSGTIRSRSERGMLGRATGLDVKSRSWTAAEKMDRTRSRSVPGERTWDRSLTKACTCEVRTIASRRNRSRCRQGAC